MTFDINVWHGFRNRARKIGDYINQHKDAYGYVTLPKKELEFHLEEITSILKQASVYMDKNGMKMPMAKWIYNVKDTKTHVSSPDFIYGHLL